MLPDLVQLKDIQEEVTDLTMTIDALLIYRDHHNLNDFFKEELDRLFGLVYNNFIKLSKLIDQQKEIINNLNKEN